MSNRVVYIDSLKARLEDLRDVAIKEKRQVRGLLEAIKQKEEQIAYIQKLLEAEGVTLGSENLDGSMAMSVSDVAYEILTKQNEHEPVYYRDLADTVLAEGKLIPGKDPYANLISHLSRDSRFVRTGRGTYALSSWGLKPAKKSGPRRRRKTK